jgi:ribosome assembly protein SQT1
MDSTDEDYDETPTFIDLNSAIEVPDNGDMPMDDDDDDAIKAPPDEMLNQAEMNESEPTVDVSKATISSHTDAVYAVSAWYDSTSKKLSIVSGAGDDRAFLHFVSPGDGTPVVRTIPLSHAHSDSISTTAFNTEYIHSDVSGTPQRNLLAVGSYDGSIVLYDAENGELVKSLEGPSDVEWCCFHPKGGTVSYHTAVRKSQSFFCGYVLLSYVFQASK